MRPKIIWLTTNSCAGDILSLLNARHPSFHQMTTHYFEFYFEPFTMAAEGSSAFSGVDNALAGRAGDYILVVEGNIPTAAKGRFCVLAYRNGRPWTALEAVKELAAKARYVVAAGTCAAFGGPYAARPNPTRAKPVSTVVPQKVINVPGCPVHPDWLAGTLYHLAAHGEPELDPYNRPVTYFGATVHDRCPRRAAFEDGCFATQPGELGCMHRLGCKGPVTYADCPQRQWCGEYTNWPVGANTPCIGCASPAFPDGVSPFFEHLPDFKAPFSLPAERAGLLTGALTALGIGVHLAANIVTDRLGRRPKMSHKARRRVARAVKNFCPASLSSRIPEKPLEAGPT